MSHTVFDFAILGDHQPEGLLTAAGLVRKGFSVLIVPSSSLGELSTENLAPLLLPPQFGQRRLNDLLFRAGFFRLEESGLVHGAQSSQTLLIKNRLLFEGAPQQWLQEIEREFPHALKTFQFLFQNSRKITPPVLKRVVYELLELQRRDSAFRTWLRSEIESSLKPIQKWNDHKIISAWVRFVVRQDPKVFRADSKLTVPYHQFLLEHARKWGAVVLTEPCELKTAWGLFQITKNMRASKLVVNGLGGGRLIARNFSSPLSEKLKAWQFLDRIDCQLSSVPEPLQETSFVDFEEQDSDLPHHRQIQLKVDRIRGEASISIGTWLNYDDSKNWTHEIERGRSVLRKLIPFLPESIWRPIPSMLELTEMRGDCVRRGQIERLIPELKELSKLQILASYVKSKIQFRKKPLTMGRRVYVVNPHFLPLRNRVSSFDESLGLLEYFEKRKKAFSK